MKAFIIHTGGYTVKEFRGSLVYLESLKDNHNGFHKDKFRYE